MSEVVAIPAWAVSAFAALFLIVIAVAGFAFKSMAARLSKDIEKVSLKLDAYIMTVYKIDKRLVRVETCVNERTSRPSTPAPIADI